MKNGKVAIVTGGTRGIGRAISLALADSGYRVYAIYARNRQGAKELAELGLTRGADIRCLRTDLTDPDGTACCVNTIKAENDHVDVVIHCAASGVHRAASKLTLKHLSWTFEVNLFSIQALLIELIPMMPRGSRIVGISSFGATHVFSPFYGAVGATKGALEALFRHYARELAPRGISVNCVCPGLVVTDAIESFPDKEEQLSFGISVTPTGRLTTPSDVAGVVLFVCSDAATQVIGQTIFVDGGRSLL
jgi:NAD(P)-dependent dehydrogenase (short-subunit alcohol dehydrogenase family)